MTTRSRTGYVLVYTLIIALVASALVLTYQQLVLNRGVQVRLNTDRTLARSLARSGVDVLRFGFREAPGRVAIPANLETGALLPFFINEPEALVKAYDRATAGELDHRAILIQLLGAPALDPLDRLVGSTPGAQVLLFLKLEPTPLYAAGPLKDAVLKQVAVTFRATARVRKAQESFEYREVITVYSLLPAAAKFTMAGLRMPDVNTLRVNKDGTGAGGTPPIVLIHSPDDCDALTLDPFQEGITAEKPLIEKNVQAAELAGSFADRGLVYLESAKEKVVRLQLSAGSMPLGETYQLYRPAGGKSTPPDPEPLPDLPAKLSSFRPPDPVNTDVSQAASIEAQVVGFHKDSNNLGLFGPPPPLVTSGATPPGDGVLLPDVPVEPGPAAGLPAAGEDSPESRVDERTGNTGGTSQIRPFGVGAYPSPTMIVGDVVRVAAGISNLAVDRDASDQDETAQAGSAGRRLPVADGNEPKLAHANTNEFLEDLMIEEVFGSSYYRHLRPFGDQGLLTNLNAMVDADGDGVKETAVASEVDYSPIRLDLTQWKYSNLFDSYEQYSQFMSKEVDIPANFCLSLASLAPSEAAQMLRKLAFGRNAAKRYDDYLVKEFELPHRDRVHQRFQQGKRSFIDTRALPADALRTAVLDSVGQHYPGEPVVIVQNQLEFERAFMSGGRIDLQGRHVRVGTDMRTNASSLVFRGKVRFEPGSGGLVEVGVFRAEAVVNDGQMDEFGPVTIRCRELILGGKGPFQAVFACSSIAQENVTDRSIVHGGLTVDGLSSSLDRPVVVAFDPRSDPTGAESFRYYRLAFPQDTGVYAMEVK